MDLILYFITKNLESKLIHTTGIQCMYSNVFSPITIANNRQKVINEKTKYSTNDNEVKIVKIDMLSIHRHYRQVYSPLRAFIDRVDNEKMRSFLAHPVCVQYAVIQRACQYCSMYKFSSRCVVLL